MSEENWCWAIELRPGSDEYVGRANHLIFKGMHVRTVISLGLFILMLGQSWAWAGFKEGKAAYDAKNYAKAFKEFSQAADQGFAEAQVNLGVMYSKGEGVR